MNKWFSINKRVLLFLAVALLLTEFALNCYIDKRFSSPASERMPSDDITIVKLWVNQVKQAKGFKIVFLGDSVIHGLASGTSRETIPFYFNQELKKILGNKNIKVFNLAIAGGGPSETFFILNALKEADIDLVIYDLNLGWFTRQNPIDHTALLSLAGNYPEGFSFEEYGLSEPNLNSTNLLGKWQLYNYRILLNYWLFGKPIRDKLPMAFDNPSILLTNNDLFDPHIKELRTHWKIKSWDYKPRPPEQRLGYFIIKDDNIQLRFYIEFLKLLEKQNFKTVFFIPPRNFELLNKMTMIDLNGYDSNYEKLITLAEKHGIKTFKYDYLLNSSYFNDTIHLTSSGNRILAKQLTADVITNFALSN